ncbi:MAG: asparagine synthase (glutamine-hydrolyzing) [Bacteroidales bacterium]|jgi:asparagine synthase (glutamine-hydrolysing)|nr:asparagine synthase (glutamine-hydrolyzing) [Bacteroidales bacterium]
MCGITGVYSFSGRAEEYKNKLELSVKSIYSRGPDDNGIYIDRNVGLGHTRLAIIDTSHAGAQPFIDTTGNYALIFNGEFYNHKEFRKELLNDGVVFKSESDTEVLLYLLIKYEGKAVEKINGCFSFAFYDRHKNQCILARDRMGINPLIYYLDKDKIIFASEMKAILAFDIFKELDHETVKTYFQLNYIPTNQCILKNIYKLEPGNFITVKGSGIEKVTYYKIPRYTQQTASNDNYKTACNKLFELLDNSVKKRLIADVPVGCFLSGGIDSSVITALAAGHTKNLNTFSIGFSDNDYFDETRYAELVAKKYNTNHTVFKVSNEDLLNNLTFVLDYIDEPFADSSALAVNILSKLTRRKATVALSGDGADEMFAGYNKHSAHLKIINAGIKEKLVAGMDFIWKSLPKSRNSKTSNLFRQLHRFASGYNLSPEDRYWFWASIGSEEYTNKLLNINIDEKRFEHLKSGCFDKDIDLTQINDILYTDMHLVLQGDMLTKVDFMSMSNCLEVRVPFLDHTVVDYAFSLPANYKIDVNTRKKILRDTFREYIPQDIFEQPKHGFEVPLLKWFRNELQYMINEELLSKEFIKEQNIFDTRTVDALKIKLKSQDPEDSASKLWALIVFQYWWKKYFNN